MELEMTPRDHNNELLPFSSSQKQRMINVTKPYLPNIDKYKKYIDDIYTSNWLTNNGPLSKELTARLSDFLGVKNLLLVNNGTIALNTAYKLINIKKRALTTPFSFIATTSSLVWDGVDVSFSDINKEDFNIDINQIPNNATYEAIVPVHVFGNACQVEEIEKFAKSTGKQVVYDAAHAFGVKYKDRSILSYGDISTLSFHATKVFHTVEGGALIINNNEIFERAQSLINFGIQKSGQIREIGINAKISEFHCAMGLAVLDDIDTILAKRQAIVEYYKRELDGYLEFQKQNENSSPNFSYMPVLFKNEEELLKTQSALNKFEIFPKRYFHPSLNLTSYIDSPKMNNSEDIASRVLCLPLYDSLEEEDLKFITKVIKNEISSYQG